jgi:hypothetical protein
VDWTCPLCNTFFRCDTEASLGWEVRRHISEHETKAAKTAVDYARASWNNYYGPSNPAQQPFEAKLTEYDRHLLEGMKIAIDKANRNEEK